MYLPENKIDPVEITAIHIKELIGTAYDNQPLCELVFEGNNMENSVLTQRAFWDAPPASGAYLSADALQSGLTENAQRWVKLRPGMSASEVISLIGLPPRMTFNSGFQYWIYDYGYG